MCMQCDIDTDSGKELFPHGLLYFLGFILVFLLFQSKSKRRIVLGLREVTKHLKLKKIRCVVISPNLERIQSKGEQ